MLSTTYHSSEKVKLKSVHQSNLGLKRFLPSTKGGTLFWALIIVYTPFAFTYFINYDIERPRLQDYFLNFFTSKEFTYGEGSGYGDGGHAYALMRVSTRLLVHSIVGSLVTFIGLAQFSDSLRASHPRTHRLAGYFYMFGSFAISITGIGVLLKLGARDIFSGPPFAILLWLLAVGAPSTTVLALYEAAIAHRFERHRDLMAFNYAIFLSAPLLRYGWILTRLIWSETKETVNLTSGFWLGDVLIQGAVVYIRSVKGDRPQIQRDPIPKWVPLAFTGASLLGTAYLVWNIPGTTLWRPEILFWWVLLVMSVKLPAMAWLYFRASQKVNDKSNSKQYWALNLWSTLALPAWCAVSFAITRHLLDGSVSEAWYGAFMAGIPVSTFASDAINLYLTKYVRDFPQPVEKTPAAQVEKGLLKV